RSPRRFARPTPIFPLRSVQLLHHRFDNRVQQRCSKNHVGDVTRGGLDDVQGARGPLRHFSKLRQPQQPNTSNQPLREQTRIKASDASQSRRPKATVSTGSIRSTRSGLPFPHRDPSAHVPIEHDAISASPTLPTFDVDANMASSYSPITASRELLEDYWFALCQVGGIYRLEDGYYCIQEWDHKAGCLEIGTYRHVIRLCHGPSEAGVVCTCPRWKAGGACMHSDLLALHGAHLSRLTPLATSPLPPAVFICRTPFKDTYLFSCVSSTGMYESGKRVIVSYQRDGRWHCESCGYMDLCKHRPHALEFATLAELPLDAQARREVGDGEEDADAEGMLLMAVAIRDERKHGCISHVRIPPPRWCALPNEDLPPTPLPPNPGAHFSLDALARCACGIGIQSVLREEPQIAPETRDAVMFGLTMCSRVRIDVLPCRACHHRRRFIGPDLGSLGVFNWNNTFLFTHELLNAYTNAFTASETPFAAFCLTVRRQYEDRCPESPFCSNETFVRAWFSFVELQDLDSKMQCPTCGPSPPVVIADGVSLATQASKLAGTGVKPPTYTDSRSERVESISSWKARQLPAIHEKAIRKCILEYLAETAIRAPSVPPDLSAVNSTYPEVASLLRLTMFEEYMAVTATNGLQQSRRKALRDLIRQVRYLLPVFAY
ncbi:hypothetical protein C8Q78DRAFT_1124971, partial [Trametes maxima]